MAKIGGSADAEKLQLRKKRKLTQAKQNGQVGLN